MKKKVICCLIMFAIITSFFALYERPAYAANSIYAEDIVSTAKDLVGKYPYVWGGAKPEDGGFDCTGLVYYIYHTQLGYDMSLDQARSKSKLLGMGEKISTTSELLPGDIVQYTISHVGIYIGNNTVVHAGSSSGVKKISINTPGLTFSYGIRLPGISQDATKTPAINNNNSSGNSTTSSTPALISTESGTWTVTIPANFKLLLYAGNASTSSATYVSAKSDSYEIRCSQRATLSNGTIRYYAAFNTSEHYWFTYCNGMSAQSNSSTKIHTINFSANGGSVSPSYKQVTAGTTYGDLPTPTRDGYTFIGWYTAANGGEQVTASTTVNLSSDQITLYAHWLGTTTTFLVTLNANGGTVPTHTILVEQGGTYGELPRPTPDNSDYSFAGWYTSADGGTKIESSSRLIANADHTLYAHWINVREAVLDPNGGTVSGSSSPIKVEYRNGGNLPVAVRQGYTFDGWYTEKSGGEKIQSGWKRFNEGAYFYAHWTPIASGSYIVTFDSCGGEFSSGSASIEVQAGGTYGKLPWCWGPTFGAEMIGWYTSPTGGTRVMDNDPLVINGDHTLYARYEKKIYTITLDPNGGTVARQISGTMSSYPQDYTVGASTQTYEGIPNAVWEGHEFLGWYTAPTGGSRVTSDSSLVIRDDHTLYAHWK